jgi:hypothetical protein
VQQWHHVAAEILGTGDKVIEDAHDALETVDCGQLIELPGHGHMAADELADVQGKGVLHLGNDGRCRPQRVEIGRKRNINSEFLLLSRSSQC